MEQQCPDLPEEALVKMRWDEDLPPCPARSQHSADVGNHSWEWGWCSHRMEGNTIFRKGWERWWGREFEEWDEDCEESLREMGLELETTVRNWGPSWGETKNLWGGVGGTKAVRQQGKAGVSAEWGILLSKKSNRLKKIVAREWSRRWRLQMEPGKVKMTQLMEPRVFAAVGEDYRE